MIKKTMESSWCFSIHSFKVDQEDDECQMLADFVTAISRLNSLTSSTVSWVGLQ